MDKLYQLLPDFLSGPSLAIDKHVIDFAATSLPEYSGSYACILDNVLTAGECAELLRAAKVTTNGEWAHAMINSGSGGQQELDTESRSCGRIIWENQDVASKIWARFEGAVPELLELKDRPEITGKGWLKKEWVYRVNRLDGWMRFLRYFDGDYFRPQPKPIISTLLFFAIY